MYLGRICRPHKNAQVTQCSSSFFVLKQTFKSSMWPVGRYFVGHRQPCNRTECCFRVTARSHASFTWFHCERDFSQPRKFTQGLSPVKACRFVYKGRKVDFRQLGTSFRFFSITHCNDLLGASSISATLPHAFLTSIWPLVWPGPCNMRPQEVALYDRYLVHSH